MKSHGSVAAGRALRWGQLRGQRCSRAAPGSAASGKVRTGPCRRKGHFPLGRPPLLQCQHSWAALRQEPELCNPLSNHTSKGEQLPDRLQHISVVSLSIMKSVSTASRADGAGLDGTHTQYFVHKIHAYTLKKRLQIKKKQNRIKPDTNDPADTMALSVDSTAHKPRNPFIHSYIVVLLLLKRS